MLAQDRHVKAKAAGALQSLAVDEDNQVGAVRGRERERIARCAERESSVGCASFLFRATLTRVACWLRLSP